MSLCGCSTEVFSWVFRSDGGLTLSNIKTTGCWTNRLCSFWSAKTTIYNLRNVRNVRKNIDKHGESFFFFILHVSETNLRSFESNDTFLFEVNEIREDFFISCDATVIFCFIPLHPCWMCPSLTSPDAVYASCRALWTINPLYLRLFSAWTGASRYSPQPEGETSINNI